MGEGNCRTGCPVEILFALGRESLEGAAGHELTDVAANRTGPVVIGA